MKNVLFPPLYQVQYRSSPNIRVLGGRVRLRIVAGRLVLGGHPSNRSDVNINGFVLRAKDKEGEEEQVVEKEGPSTPVKHYKIYEEAHCKRMPPTRTR